MPAFPEVCPIRPLASPTPFPGSHGVKPPSHTHLSRCRPHSPLLRPSRSPCCSPKPRGGCPPAPSKARPGHPCLGGPSRRGPHRPPPPGFTTFCLITTHVQSSVPHQTGPCSLGPCPASRTKPVLWKMPPNVLSEQVKSGRCLSFYNTKRELSRRNQLAQDPVAGQLAAELGQNPKSAEASLTLGIRGGCRDRAGTCQSRLHFPTRGSWGGVEFWGEYQGRSWG